MKNIFLLSFLLIISLCSYAQDYVWVTKDSSALACRINADMVLSKLDSIKGMKILFSIEGTGHPELLHPKNCREYYIIYNDNNIYKEYVVITDSISNILYIKNIDKETEIETLKQQKRLTRLQKKELKRLIEDNKMIQDTFNSFNINKNSYGTEFVTSVTNPKIPDEDALLSYFVIKDECDRRYGEFCLPFMTLPCPIDPHLLIYLARELCLAADIL